MGGDMMVTVQGVIDNLLSDANVIRIDYTIEPSEIKGYKVSLEWDRLTRHGTIIRYFDEYVVPGDAKMTPGDVLNTNAYHSKVKVNKQYRISWGRKRKSRWRWY